MSEAQFEEFLRREAVGYNAPPSETPRDLMWEAIATARRDGRVAATRRPAQRGVPGGAWWIGLAATLIAGVAIGRFAWRDSIPVAPSTVARVAMDSATVGYQVVTAQHLARAEALLTAVRSDEGRPADAQLARWTHDVLANTRLLLDSPASADPERRKLLEDLELVLVQLMQHTPASAPDAGDDRAHWNRSLERTQVIPRLRAALTAEPVRGT